MIPNDRLQELIDWVLGMPFLGKFDARDLHDALVELLTLREKNRLLIEDAERLATWLENSPIDYSNGITCMGIDEGNVHGWNGHAKVIKEHSALMKHVKGE